MSNKFLTESGWKTLVQKFKVKDNGLQAALAAYEKLAEDKYAERKKALGQVSKLAGDLKKSKECMAQAEVTKYLAEVTKAVDAEQKAVEAAEKSASKAATDANEAAPPKPDPKMLQEVWQLGSVDGMDGLPSRSKLFAKAPEFQSKYDEGYKSGLNARKRMLENPRPQAPVMNPISKGEYDRSVEYTKRKKTRKEFIQYLNKWWKTRLPEDL